MACLTDTLLAYHYFRLFGELVIVGNCQLDKFILKHYNSSGELAADVISKARGST